MCHKCVTMCQIKNRMRKCTLDSPNKPTYKFEQKISNGVARTLSTEKYINKANHFNTGPTTSSRHSKNLIKK